MATWKLRLEYEGTRYSGWQEQRNARTVQGELRRAAEELLGEPVDLAGAGRTDSGVHALEQVAHLRCRKRLQPQELLYGLNDRLPADIHVLSLQPAPGSFHARHAALSRYYLYQISTRRTALAKRFVWWVRDPLDRVAMQRVAEWFVGRHDFRSFVASGDKEASTQVEVYESRVEAAGDLILYRIGASHFLWKMVRRIVGALVEVGRSNLTDQQVLHFLSGNERGPAAWTAPPSGLFLERVLYEGDPPPGELRPALFRS